MWDKISVGQFISLLDVETNNNLILPEKQQKMLSILESKPESDYDYIKYRELVRQYNEKLQFFNEIPQDVKPVDFVEANGTKYKFCFELTEITSGQYIDIGVFSGNIISLNKIAACFFLPMQGDKYLPYGTIPHDKVAEDLLDAKFIEVYGCMVFFYQLFKELINATITSSTLSVEAKEAIMRLWKDGDGLLQQKK